MFSREPETVWCWYLARFARVAGAQPNAAHRAIARIQLAFSGRVALITQNIDGLHARAGSPAEHTYAIHGDARFVRCWQGCHTGLEPMPPVGPQLGGKRLSPETRTLLRCGRCGGWTRPHVLWFDEYYNEEHYRSESALAVARSASLLITVGTTGATSLPLAIGRDCRERGVPIVDVNTDHNVFEKMSRDGGLFVREPATVALTRMAGVLGV
jgi:NAD-dependent deacetylase